MVTKKGKKRMSTRAAKAKGRRLQNEVRELLEESFPDLEEGDIRTAIMGQNGEDIILSPAARKKIPYSIECKNQESLNIWAALKQAEENSDVWAPMVIFKRNRSKTYAVLEIDKLLELLKKR